MTDIRTTETVVIDERYGVTIAEDGEGFQAAVTSRIHENPINAAFSAMMASGNSKWMDVDNAPRVTGKEYYETAGEAVDVYKDFLTTEEEEFEDDKETTEI